MSESYSAQGSANPRRAWVGISGIRQLDSKYLMPDHVYKSTLRASCADPLLSEKNFMTSIDDNLDQTTSITDYERVLDLFTDRIQELRLFASYLNDDPPRNTILFFHGDGGNGKSWLLRLLRERYCRRLEPKFWTHVKELQNGNDFTQQFENCQDAVAIPCAYLDFADKGRAEQNPREDYYGLLLLRRQLGQQGLSFHMFDFAVLLYLLKGLGKPPDSVKSLFPQDEMNLISKLIELIYENKTMSLGVSIWLFLPNAPKR